MRNEVVDKEGREFSRSWDGNCTNKDVRRAARILMINSGGVRRLAYLIYRDASLPLIA